MAKRIAHRGAAGTHPENTMAAFRRAMEIGVHGIELDIHRTVDGELAVIHDPALDRTTSGKGLIMATTMAEIRSLDAGSWKGKQFAGERVPTLREVLRETPPSLYVYIELKAGSIHYPGIESDLLKLLAEEKALSRVQISSFDHHGLRRLHELAPELPLGMLYHENLLDAVALAKEIGANALHPAWEWVTPELVAAAHAAGLEVNTWTVNWELAIARVQMCGVDGMISDFPDRIP